MRNFGGMPNMQQLMKQAQKMQKQMEQAQAELETKKLDDFLGLSRFFGTNVLLPFDFLKP